MIKIKISPELNFAYLVKKGFIDSPINYRNSLKKKDLVFIRSSQGFDSFLENFNQDKNDLITYQKNLQEQLDSFDFSSLNIVETFFGEKFPSKIDLFIGLGNSSKVTYGKNYHSFYLLLPRGFPNTMTPKRDFQIVIHELIHSLHYKKELELKAKNVELFEYVVRCFAPEGLLFGTKPVVGHLDKYKLEKIFTIIKSNKLLRDCLEEINCLFS